MKLIPAFKTLVAWSFITGVAFATVPTAPSVPSATTAPTAPSDERSFQRVADVKRGDRVVLRGEITRILDEDEFVLADESGRIRVYLGWKNDVDQLELNRGDLVIIEGRADDDAIFGTRPEIYARVVERANGARIHLTR
jgi:uncharacterized protein YdeI (BOF family)